MVEAEILVAALVATAGLGALAMRLDIPYPIVLVLGGLAIAFIPGVPHPRVEPELIFLLFLPPLLYFAAYTSSTQELLANVRPISVLAIGLTTVTALAVAAVAHWVVKLEWAPAFVLGALVAPTDPISATTIIRRFGVRHRVVTILEGESLVNDGT